MSSSHSIFTGKQFLLIGVQGWPKTTVGASAALLLSLFTTTGVFAYSLGHSSAGHSSGGFHGSSHGSSSYHNTGSHGYGRGGYGYAAGGYGYGYGQGYGSNALNYDGLPHNYDPGHPVQTGASFSGPAHIDSSQVHYFVQEYHWDNAASTTQEPRNANGTIFGVQSEPRAAGLNLK